MQDLPAGEHQMTTVTITINVSTEPDTKPPEARLESLAKEIKEFMKLVDSKLERMRHIKPLSAEDVQYIMGNR